MCLSESNWKVYDVVPCGVSLATGNRAGFDSGIRKDGIDSPTGRPLNRNNGALYG